MHALKSKVVYKVACRAVYAADSITPIPEFVTDMRVGQLSTIVRAGELP